MLQASVPGEGAPSPVHGSGPGLSIARTGMWADRERFEDQRLGLSAREGLFT